MVANTKAGQPSPRLIIMKGPYKEKYGTVYSPIFVDLRVTLEDTDEIVKVHYVNVEVVGSDGLAKIEPVIDMLGKELTVGDYVAFGQAGKQAKSHNLCIGKIFEISDFGTVSLHKLIENGIKTLSHYRPTVKISDSFRLLRLPMDEKDFIFLMMKDFNPD